MSYYTIPLKAKIAHIKNLAELVSEMDDDEEFIFATLKVNDNFGMYCPKCGEYKPFKDYGIRRTVPGAAKHTPDMPHTYADQASCSVCRNV